MARLVYLPDNLITINDHDLWKVIEETNPLLGYALDNGLAKLANHAPQPGSWSRNMLNGVSLHRINIDWLSIPPCGAQRKEFITAKHFHPDSWSWRLPVAPRTVDPKLLLPGLEEDETSQQILSLSTTTNSPSASSVSQLSPTRRSQHRRRKPTARKPPKDFSPTSRAANHEGNFAMIDIQKVSKDSSAEKKNAPSFDASAVNGAQWVFPEEARAHDSAWITSWHQELMEVDRSYDEYYVPNF